MEIVIIHECYKQQVNSDVTKPHFQIFKLPKNKIYALNRLFLVYVISYYLTLFGFIFF